MKKNLLLLLTIFLVACSSDSSNKNSLVELEVSDGNIISSKTKSGTIATVGEVDRYKLNLVESNRTLQIKCTRTNTDTEDVDLLVNVYEENANGELVMVTGDHEEEGNYDSADVRVSVTIDQPKELYVHVRDLLDTQSSDTPYHISAYYEADPDGNDSFLNSTTLTIGGDAARDAIGRDGDVDCFNFTVTEAGIYDIQVLFEPFGPTAVDLAIDLYAADSVDPIDSRDKKDVVLTKLVHYLVPGTYNVLVYDIGKDNFDNTSLFNVSVSRRDVEEILQNDTAENAYDADTDGFNGASIDYYSDLDFYRIDTSAPADIKVMTLNFSSEASMKYRLSLYNIETPETFNLESASPAFTHNYQGGENGDGDYQVDMKLENNEDYYLLVQPFNGEEVFVAGPYTASVSLESISDADEAGDGNDLDSDAIDITAGSPHTGKIAYRGDIDWYYITIPTANEDRVLSFNLDIPETDRVEYAMTIIRDNRAEESSSYSVDKNIFNGSVEHRSVDLKTSFIVPAQDPASFGDATYQIKVFDFQDDDGADANFSLSWSIDTIPDSLGAIPGSIGAASYNDEKNEKNNTQAINIDYTNGGNGSFKANTTFLTFDNDTDDVATTVTLPWVGGFIDYQGDEDWYGLDLSEPLVPTDTSWYYTISVEIVAQSTNGSDVEYTWEYHPDSNNDGNVHANRCSPSARHCSGVQASGGDTSIAIADLNSTSSDNGNIWLGSGDQLSDWKGMVFFRISDFNYMYTATDTPNLTPDNDWSLDVPYFFRVTLTYHPGALSPN